jgi:hypothetical protein
MPLWRGVADQQLGRARDRERAGSTGRAGRSRAGDWRAVLFFIGVYLNSIRRIRAVFDRMYGIVIGSFGVADAWPLHEPYARMKTALGVKQK